MARSSPKTSSPPPHFCRFYIVRHGQTEMNVLRQVQGQIDSPLTQKGIQQAKKLAKELADIKFAAVYASDLLRTRRTAKILAKEHQLIIKTSRAIRERSYGIFEGRVVNEIQQELADVYEQRRRLSTQARLVFKVHESIESDEDLVGRCLMFLRQAAVAHANSNVLVVSHHGVIRALLIKLGHFDYERADQIYIENLGYIVIDCDGVDFFVRETPGVKEVNTN
ncbi:MAG: histidine phosphatase family protein [Patescibacteria group bacterium]|nr:histidine phosphatase family protein [Patescibacteria group bacterium]